MALLGQGSTMIVAAGLNKMAVSLKIRILDSVVWAFDPFSDFLDFLDRGRVRHLFIYIVSKDIFFFIFLVRLNREWSLSLEKFIKVTSFENCRGNHEEFCMSKMLNFWHFRGRVCNIANGSVVEGQWDAQEARITSVRFSSSILSLCPSSSRVDKSNEFQINYWKSIIIKDQFENYDGVKILRAKWASYE